MYIEQYSAYIQVSQKCLLNKEKNNKLPQTKKAGAKQQFLDQLKPAQLYLLHIVSI